MSVEYATHTQEESEGNERVPSGYEFATLQAKLSELDFVFLNRFMQVGLQPQYSTMIEPASLQGHPQLSSGDAQMSGCKPGQRSPGAPICTTAKWGSPLASLETVPRTQRAIVRTLGSWVPWHSSPMSSSAPRNLTDVCLP